MKTRSLVLDSKQNFAWHSMQEIIPFIVETWRQTATPDHEVNVIDIDQVSSQVLLSHALQADQIVLSCFTPKIFRFAAYLRFQLKLNTRFIVHLHNQASIACWPIRHWTRPDFIRKCDVFVSSCQRDLDCLYMTYPKARGVVIPFSSHRAMALQTPAPAPSNEISFVFIGRISSQKNLHTLFLSLSFLKKQRADLKWSLHFFGAEDHLGSPNMNIQDTSYLNFLLQLSEVLGVRTNLIIHGFQSREVIHTHLQKQRQIFVVPSLHSDENFGMAAFQCLTQGHLAVLSDWGGHTDFKLHFPDQTFLTPVLQTSRGPAVHPDQLFEQIFLAVQQYGKVPGIPLPKAYQMESLIQKSKEILEIPPGAPEPEPTSEIADMILARIPIEVSNASPPIFESYADPLATAYFQSYGMQTKWPLPADSTELRMVPWLKSQKDAWQVEDPHRGHLTLPKTDESRQRLKEMGYFY